ncbi:putative RNA helicase [Helianthus anomalus]
MAVAKLDFNSQEEKDIVDLMFKNAMLYLSEEDRNLPAIQSMMPLLRRGIAIHHYGLLPIVKELVELVFQEDLVKAVFATETFAMGLNKPAKTVVFTSIRKGDGDSHRYVDPSGRRGKDEYDMCIIMIDNQETSATGQFFQIELPLILDLMRREDVSIWDPIRRDLGLFTPKEVIASSFYQLQLYYVSSNPNCYCIYKKSINNSFQHVFSLVFQSRNVMGRKLAKLKTKVANLDAYGESQDEKHIQSFKRKELNHEIQQLETKLFALRGHIACLIDTGDELIVSEWIYDAGILDNLDYHQIAALASCFILGDKSSEQIQVTSELAMPLQQLKDIARRIAGIQLECKLEANVDEYVMEAVRPFLMDVIYHWSKVSSSQSI